MGRVGVGVLDSPFVSVECSGNINVVVDVDGVAWAWPCLNRLDLALASTSVIVLWCAAEVDVEVDFET